MAAVLEKAGIMDERGHSIHRAAKDTDNMGGARLISLDILRLDPGTAQIVAAGRGDAVGKLKAQAAVVHQNAHQLRRGKRHPRRLEVFVEAFQL